MHQQRTPDQDDADEQVDVAWRTHAPVAMRFATAVVGPIDAHDVTTTAFLRVTRQPDWTDIEHLDRYLIRAVRNQAQDLYRQRRRRWQRDLLAVRPEATTDALPDVDLLRAVASLSVQQRSVVFLAYWHDMTEAEIAETLDVARSTVHRTLTRARIALRKALT
ncbi:RNA polymerase sigma factor [Ilumatobacter nonamiensis]|uniref:RNA polymerase sigma factor n=1 Tax=Ilumatobacter nonamiensis TaxID=467093 RepID=UPI00130D90D4|nr:sigma-70 family RNA polymerase sigma factor [Ilumatobacter nonamiensis]